MSKEDLYDQGGLMPPQKPQTRMVGSALAGFSCRPIAAKDIIDGKEAGDINNAQHLLINAAHIAKGCPPLK